MPPGSPPRGCGAQRAGAADVSGGNAHPLPLSQSGCCSRGVTESDAGSRPRLTPTGDASRVRSHAPWPRAARAAGFGLCLELRSSTAEGLCPSSPGDTAAPRGRWSLFSLLTPHPGCTHFLLELQIVFHFLGVCSGSLQRAACRGVIFCWQFPGALRCPGTFVAALPSLEGPCWGTGLPLGVVHPCPADPAGAGCRAWGEPRHAEHARSRAAGPASFCSAACGDRVHLWFLQAPWCPDSCSSSAELFRSLLAALFCPALAGTPSLPQKRAG